MCTPGSSMLVSLCMNANMHFDEHAWALANTYLPACLVVNPSSCQSTQGMRADHTPASYQLTRANPGASYKRKAVVETLTSLQAARGRCSRTWPARARPCTIHPSAFTIGSWHQPAHNKAHELSDFAFHRPPIAHPKGAW